jgi:hypothetical protein
MFKRPAFRGAAVARGIARNDARRLSVLALESVSAGLKEQQFRRL